MISFAIHLSKAHLPLVESPSGNKTKDLSGSSDKNCFKIILSVAAFSRGNIDTIPKILAIEALNTLVD